MSWAAPVEGQYEISSYDRTPISAYGLPHAGDYNDEDAYNLDTGKMRWWEIKVTCPSCHRLYAACMSPYTVPTGGGWRWCGCDHREPYTDWVTLCSCGIIYTFTTYTPQ